MTTILLFVLSFTVALAIANFYYCRKWVRYANQQLKAARIAFLKVVLGEVNDANFSLKNFITLSAYSEIRFYQDPEERRAFKADQGTLEDLHTALNHMQDIWGISAKDLGI